MTQAGTAAFLGSIRLFSALDHSALQRLSFHVELLAFKKGQVVLFRGEIPVSVFLVRAGCVSLERARPRRRELLWPGAVFAEAALGEPAPSDATARAVQDGTLLLALPAAALAGLVPRDARLN